MKIFSKKLQIFLSLLLIACIYIPILSEFELQDVINSFAKISIKNITLLIFISSISIIIVIARFLYLTQSIDSNIKTRIKVALLSNILLIVPAPGLPELNKIIYLKKSFSLKFSTLLIIIEKFSAFFAIFIIFTFLGSFLFLNKTFIILLILFFFFSIIIIYYILNLNNIFSSVYNRTLKKLKTNKFFILNIIIISLIIQLFSFLNPVILADNFNLIVNNNYLNFLFLLILTNIVTSIPISIGGIGVRDAIIIFLGSTLFNYNYIDLAVIAIYLNLLNIYNNFFCIFLLLRLNKNSIFLNKKNI